jgi:electron transfer flavoprotein alpha subunit
LQKDVKSLARIEKLVSDPEKCESWIFQFSETESRSGASWPNAHTGTTCRIQTDSPETRKQRNQKLVPALEKLVSKTRKNRVLDFETTEQKIELQQRCGTEIGSTGFRTIYKIQTHSRETSLFRAVYGIFSLCRQTGKNLFCVFGAVAIGNVALLT